MVIVILFANFIISD